MNGYNAEAAKRAELAAEEGRMAVPADQLELAKMRRSERMQAERGRERIGRWAVQYRQLAPDGVTITASVWVAGTDYEGERMFDGGSVAEARAKVVEFVSGR